MMEMANARQVRGTSFVCVCGGGDDWECGRQSGTGLHAGGVGVHWCRGGQSCICCSRQVWYVCVCVCTQLLLLSHPSPPSPTHTPHPQEEGIVAKALDSPWKADDKSGAWLKLKPDYFHMQDVRAVFFSWGKGGRGAKAVWMGRGGGEGRTCWLCEKGEEGVFCTEKNKDRGGLWSWRACVHPYDLQPLKYAPLPSCRDCCRRCHFYCCDRHYCCCCCCLCPPPRTHP